MKKGNDRWKTTGILTDNYGIRFFLNMTKRGFSEVVENECHAEFFPMEFWTEKYEDELESIKRAALLSVSLSRFSVLLQMAKCRLSAALKRDKTPHKSRTTDQLFFQVL